MTVEFDPRKDAANLAKHGVSLVEGDGVLDDPLALTVEDSSARRAAMADNRYKHLRICLRGSVDEARSERADYFSKET